MKLFSVLSFALLFTAGSLFAAADPKTGKPSCSKTDIDGIVAKSCSAIEAKKEAAFADFKTDAFKVCESYVWVQKEKIVVFHPNPAVVGKDGEQLKFSDKDGSFYKTFMNVTKGDGKGDYVQYEWAKKPGEKPEVKCALVKRCGKTPYIVGFGIYSACAPLKITPVKRAKGE